MSEKISIRFKPQLEPIIETIHSVEKKSIKFKPQLEPKSVEKEIIENQPKPKLSEHIRNNFICPLEKLIKNDGVSNNTLIASVDALYIMREILNSIINKDETNIIEILEKAAYEDLDHDQSEPTNCADNPVIEEEISDIDDDDEYGDDDDEYGDDDDDDKEEEEEEEDEEKDEEYDYYEDTVIDSYIQEDKLSDDEENMYD
jgi:hypothetical protein